MKWKRLFYYLIINIIISACTVLVVLQLWDRYRPPSVATTEAAANLTSPTPVLFTVTPRGDTTLPAPAIITVTVPVVVQPSPEPPRGVITYTVQSGDTLGAIAIRFEISLDALMAANELDNPDIVSEGQVLLIPTPEGREPTATSTPLPPTPTATGTPTPLVSETPSGPTPIPQVSIIAVIGAGDLPTEHVQIQLSGGAELSLLGWQIKDGDGNVYTFPELTLFANGAIAVYTKAGQSTVNFLYWGLDHPIWASGETVTLVDAQGVIQATFVIP